MIVPMKKVSLVLLKREKKQALVQLRKAGVMHLESLEGSGEKLQSLKESYETMQVASSILSELKKAAKKGIPACEPLSDEEIISLCSAVVANAERKKSLLDAIAANTVELERFTEWGEVNPEDFDYLAEKGLYFTLYEIPKEKYNLIGDDVKVLMVNKGKSHVHFLLISESKDEPRPAGLPAEAYAVPVPRCSTEQLREEIKAAHAEILSLDADNLSKVPYVAAIAEVSKKLAGDIDFENIYTGMGTEEGDTSASLAWLTGFVPVDALDTLKKSAHDNHWAFAIADPSDDDAVPTKLKNNKLVSLIYPLTDFLGTVPGYHEYDISGWFLLFFTVFFGMIFGDAGYGILLTLAVVAGIFKTKAAGKKVGLGLQLGLLLGLATVVWGTVTCTWFGLDMALLPGWLKEFSVHPFSNAYVDYYNGENGTTTVTQNLQIFCFSLALLQLTVAHLHGIGRYRKSLRCLGEIGAMFMLWGMYYVVLSVVVSGIVFPMDLVLAGIPVGLLAEGLIGLGFVLNFVFANYEGKLGESILTSLKNIISVILGVVNVFSDIVSYIRLWAVALAGSAISGTVNTMAGPMVGHAVMFLALVLLLVVGHGLNIILNVLSVVVHGVRLNTLEFSNHLGMSWSGFKYEPFSETVTK